MIRLLNTTDFTLTQFEDPDVPPYAIVSHVWSKEELLHLKLSAERQDLINGVSKQNIGYTKVLETCRIARDGLSCREKLDWLWIDTVCIDKSNAVEENESINSMFKFYKKAEICLAVLLDVHPAVEGNKGYKRVDESCLGFLEDQFKASSWFTRGWTLQELLAPDIVTFLNSSYEIIGSRIVRSQDPSLVGLIQEATRIHEDVLSNGLDVSQTCIARRLSWAARRRTTRPEDLAYCLVGLFNVRLVPQYGEGINSAFYRLQREILGQPATVDESIFAWKLTHHSSTQQWTGLLAKSPLAFTDCGNLCKLEYAASDTSQLLTSDYNVTFRGIELELTLPRGIRPKSKLSWIHPLRCGLVFPSGRTQRLWLHIKIIDTPSSTPAHRAPKARRWTPSVFYADGSKDYDATLEGLGWNNLALMQESYDQQVETRGGYITPEIRLIYQGGRQRIQGAAGRLFKGLRSPVTLRLHFPFDPLEPG